MLPLFPTARKVSGWDSRPAPSGVGTWHRHPSGWRVRHCGHPTAHRPWRLIDPEGETVRTPDGLAWTHLPDAKKAAEAVLAGEAHVVVEGETQRLIFSPPPRPTENAGEPAGVGE